MFVDMIKFCFQVFLFFGALLGGVILLGIFNKIGWVNVGIGFGVLIACIIAYVVWTERQPNYSLEDQRYDEYIANLRQEVERPIIQARLAKQANESIDLNGIITGKATFTDAEGKSRDLDINVNLKIK